MRLELPASPVRSLLKSLLAAGLAAADPYHAVLRRMSVKGQMLQVGRRCYDLRQYHRVVAVGAGKASVTMAQALEQVLGSRLDGGLLVVNRGQNSRSARLVIVEAGHPIPDRAGLRAAARLRAMVSELTSRDLVFVLLSGGASSLLPSPAPGLFLRDKQQTTKRLLGCGATIQEVNTVRKHLSVLKGGGLATATQATMVTLVLSDVPDDDLGCIGSGPTVADPTTFADAIAILQRYAIWKRIPGSVRRHLSKGRRGAIPETLKPDDERARSIQHVIIGNNAGMLAAVVQAARASGMRAVPCSSTLTGEARVVGQRLAALGRALARRGLLGRSLCFVAGGEPTVTVTGRGQGGRAQEVAAAAAMELSGLPNVWVAAFGTDGLDGPTDVAGAVIGGDTVTRARKLGVNLRAALDRHNTYPALKALRCHIRTGPTGTNVNDLYLLIVR